MIDRISRIDIGVRATIMLMVLCGGVVAGIMLESVLGWIFIIIGLCALVFHIYIVNLSETSNVNSIMKSNDVTIKNLKIEYDDYFCGEDGGTILLINERDKLLYVMKRDSLDEEYKVNKIPFNKVVESGIIENEHIISKVSKSGMIGRSLIGGILAGGVGAIIGGVTSDKSTVDQVNKVKLSIVVDDLMNPVYDIIFFILEKPTTKENPYYKSMMEKCILWHKRMTVIINRNDK